MTTYNTGNSIGSVDPRDLYDNAQNLDAATNSQSAEWTDRLGNKRPTIAGAIDPTGLAQAAATSAQESAQQAARAATARDAAFINADVYPSWTEGLAATGEGEQFQVIRSSNPNEIIRYRRTETGAVEVARYPRGGFSIANASIYASDWGIKVNSSAKTITFNSGVRITVGTQYVTTSEEKVLNYAAAVGNNAHLFYDPASDSFGFRDSDQPFPQDVAVFGFVELSTGRLRGPGIGAYELDGARVSAGERNLPITGRLYGGLDSVVVDTHSKTISISGNPRVVASAGGSFNVPDQQISYENAPDGTTHYLVVNAATHGISLEDPGFFSTVSEGFPGSMYIVLGQMVPREGFFWGLDIRGGTKGGVAFGQVLGRASGVNLDTETKTITVSGRVFFQDGTNILGSGSVSFDEITYSPHVVVIDRMSGGIRLVRTALYGDILPSESIIGSYEPSTETLTGFPNGYTLNGIEVGGAVTGDPVVPRIPEIGWDLPGVYDAPPMPGYRPSSAIPMSTVDSFMIQGWFDGLVSDHPEYVTRTHLGDTATGLPVYAYRFKPDMGGSSVQPRVMIQGAIHSEAMSYVLPFHVMDLIANNWEDDPILEAFRWGLDITVIPVVNPYGVNNRQRQNSNGVDLNRNYPTFWKSGATHGSTFLSELETQYSFQVMKEFKPHILLDSHNFGTQDSGAQEGAFLWFPGYTEGTLRAAQSMINRMARKWKDEHPWMPPASVLDRGVGSITSPGAAANTAIAMGAEAITFETGDRLIGDPTTSSQYSELAVKCGVEAIINYLVILLRR